MMSTRQAALGSFVIFALLTATTNAEITRLDDQNEVEIGSIGQLLERMDALEGHVAQQRQMIVDLQSELEKRDSGYQKLIGNLQSELSDQKKELQGMKRLLTARDRRMQRLQRTNGKSSSYKVVKEAGVGDESNADHVLRRNGPNMQHIRQIDPEQATVAFSAGLSKPLSNIGVNQNIVFDSVETNFGNGYNAHHGIFVAPVSGTYVFFTTLFANNLYGHTVLTCHFVINGGGKYTLYVESSSRTYSDTASQMIIKYLNKGDDVSVQTLAGVNHVYGDTDIYSSFSGFLLWQNYSVNAVVGK